MDAIQKNIDSQNHIDYLLQIALQQDILINSLPFQIILYLILNTKLFNKFRFMPDQSIPKYRVFCKGIHLILLFRIKISMKFIIKIFF